MPRSTQSREAGIIAYFQTADLPIAQVVMGLAKEALGVRLAKSAAAKATATKVTAPKPVVAPPAAPKKAKAKKKAKAPKAARVKTAAQIEQEVNDGATIE